MRNKRKTKNDKIFLSLVFVSLSLLLGLSEAATSLPKPVKLALRFYKVHNTCRNAETFVKHQVELEWKKKNGKVIVPQLLRLLSTDCLVTGCDASILLDGKNSEKRAPQNKGLGGFKLIDNIKTVLESRCPGVVSCSDILHLATRDAVNMAGGPSYPVLTGRRDGMTSSFSSVDLPSPSISLDQLIKYFNSKGLDLLDMTTLLGAHVTGRTHCRYIEDRLYNFNGTKKPDPTMATSLLKEMRKKCPKRVKKNQGDPLVFLNPESGSQPYNITQIYYSNVLKNQAVLGIDQQLLYGSDPKEIVTLFSKKFELFMKSFALSINRMGTINVLTGKNGEIRRNCHFTNKDNPRLK